MSAVRDLVLSGLVLQTGLVLADTISGRVVGVSDGDAITLLRDKTQIKIRRAGIDAPWKAQAFGNAANQCMADIVFGKDVRVDAKKRHKYGRTIARVWAASARLSNARQPNVPRRRGTGSTARSKKTPQRRLMVETCDGERPLCGSEIQGQVSGGELVGPNECIVPIADGGENWQRTLAGNARISEADVRYSLLIN